MTSRRRTGRRILQWLIVIALIINAFSALHAYRFTHFAAAGSQRTGNEDSLSFGQKLSAVAFGASIPKPVNDKTPTAPFRTVRIDGKRQSEAWLLRAPAPKGTIVIFHGYAGCRSGMLAKAELIRKLGYNCILPDFSGAGGSAGNSCSIGYHEANEVRTWYDYAKGLDSGRVYLMGQSMGAVAIMKAMHDKPLLVAGLILECPYGSMLQTVKNRFRSVGLPTAPMAHLLVFWGGAIQGFNAFSLKPESYARSLKLPVLLIRGSLDKRVTPEETAAIFANLPGPKLRLELGGAGHNDFLERAGEEWESAVDAFLRNRSAH